jgi:diguanylate cyclase (GGDEF)-like protein
MPDFSRPTGNWIVATMPTLDGSVRRLTAKFVRNGRLPQTVAVIWLMTVLFIAVLAAAASYSRFRTDTRLREQVATIAGLTADRATLSFDVVDGLLMSVIDDIDVAALDSPDPWDESRRTALREMLAHHQARSTGVVSLTLANAAGYQLASSLGTAQERRIERLEYYRALAGGPRDAPMIWTVETPAGARPIVQMARRIEYPDGRPAGAVVAEINLQDRIGDFERSLAFDAGDFVSLRDRENELLAGHLAAPDGALGLIGIDIVPNAIAQGSADGISYGQSTKDGKHRLIAYRKLARYPLYIVYGKGVEEVLSIWRYELMGVGLAALMALAASTVVTIGIRRHVAVTKQLETVRAHLKDSNRALRTALAATELMAAKDQLTDLWNRRTFDERLRESVAHLQRHEGVFSLLLIDIDHFKGINDRYGHLAGDDVLRRFADVLRERLRQNDVAARWGGEEFAVLADGASLENGFLLAEQIRAAVAATIFPGADRATISVGVAEYIPGECEDELLQRVDQALYAAKRIGRNCVVAADGREPTEILAQAPSQ